MSLRLAKYDGNVTRAAVLNLDMNIEIRDQLLEKTGATLSTTWQLVEVRPNRNYVLAVANGKDGYAMWTSDSRRNIVSLPQSTYTFVKHIQPHFGMMESPAYEVTAKGLEFILPDIDQRRPPAPKSARSGHERVDRKGLTPVANEDIERLKTAIHQINALRRKCGATFEVLSSGDVSAVIEVKKVIRL